MVKKLLVAGGIAALAGCAGIGIIRTFGSEPLVLHSVEVGATRQSVMALGVPLQSTYSAKTGSGTCLNFTLQKDGQSMPYYVGLNSVDKVKAAGFSTCAEADSRGNLNGDRANYRTN